MQFRLVMNVEHLHLNPDETELVDFDYGGHDNIHVLLRSQTENDPSYQRGNGVVTATCECEPNPPILGMLNDITQRKLPAGSKHNDVSESYLDAEGRIGERHVMPLEVFPADYQQYAREVFTTLADYAERTVNVIKWRLHGYGSYSPCHPFSFMFSLDGGSWHYVYDVMKIGKDAYAGLGRLGSYKDEIRKMVADNQDEPLGHGLWREAWHLAFKNPRAALLLGVSAAEVGIKHGLTAMVPDALWLFENMPSPDIIKIMAYYLDELKSRRPEGTVLTIPDDIRRRIVIGVETRNKIAHTGRIPTSKEWKNHQLMLQDNRKLKEFLWSVQQLLWIMDYNAGFKWAEDYIWNAQIIGHMITDWPTSNKKRP